MTTNPTHLADEQQLSQANANPEMVEMPNRGHALTIDGGWRW